MKFKQIFPLCCFTLALLVVSAIPTKAQLDTTFGTDGVATLHVDASNVPVNSFLLPTGKILVINQGIRQQNQFTKYYFVRLNNDGTPDTTFGTNGVVQLPIPAFSNANLFAINSATRQADGKIVMVGTADNDGLVMRFNEDGTLDTTFAKGGVSRPNIDPNADQARGVAQQTDGKLIVGGTILTGTLEGNKLFLMRFDANGNLDSSFGNQNGYITHPAAFPFIGGVAIQSNGKILTTPQREAESNGTFRAGAIYRFEANGSFDESFSPVYRSEGVFKGFHLLADDRFVIAENENKSDHLLRVHTDLVVTRFTANGEADSTFGAMGRTSVDVTSAMPDASLNFASQSDGRIILSAITSIEPNRSKVKGSVLSVVRLNTDGSLNGKNLVTNLASFPNARDYAGSVLVQHDGRVIIVCAKPDIENATTDLVITRSLNVPLQIYRLKGAPFEYHRPGVLALGNANATVFRPVEQKWYVNPLDFGSFFGLAGDIPIPADFIGDFRSDITVFRPETGMWYVAKNFGTASEEFLAVKWGKAGDIPIPRDFDGDSKDDIAVFRPENGNWYIRNSSDGSHRTVRWGMEGDKPVAGDFDGDGFGDIAVWRPENGTWYILKSSDGDAAFIQFGLAGDIPIPEDFDGDGKMDIGVYRPMTGSWYVLKSKDGALNAYNWGRAGDIPIPADYDGDKKMDIGVWRSEDRNWYIIQSGNSTSVQYPFGLAGDIPIPGRY